MQHKRSTDTGIKAWEILISAYANHDDNENFFFFNKLQQKEKLSHTAQRKFAYRLVNSKILETLLIYYL